MKKIALVYDAIYPYVTGGGEIRFYHIGKYLSQQGFEVHFYGMKFWEGANTIYQEGMYYHGICSPKNLYTSQGKRSMAQAVYFGLHCIKLLKEDFDIIDCCAFPYFSLFTCKVVSLIKRKKLFSTWHEVWGKSYWKEYIGVYAPVAYTIEKLSSKLPDHIIAVSEKTAQKIKSEFSVKHPITVIPNGIDEKEIQSTPPAKKKSDIIYSGRLMDFKHLDFLITSVAKLKKTYKNISCLIIGDGPEREKLEILTKKLAIEKNVTFLGFLPRHRDVYAYIKASKVFVLLSDREGFGISIIESAACGTPAVVLSHPNSAAGDLIIDDKNGFHCDLTLSSITTSIQKILTSNKPFQRTSTVLSKQYSWGIITTNLKTVYEQ